MKRCIGGIRGGIATYTPEKSYYKTVGWIYTIGGLPLRHHPFDIKPKFQLNRRVPITAPRKRACLKPNATSRFPRISLAVVYVALGRAPVLRTAYAQS